MLTTRILQGIHSSRGWSTQDTIDNCEHKIIFRTKINDGATAIFIAITEEKQILFYDNMMILLVLDIWDVHFLTETIKHLREGDFL